MSKKDFAISLFSLYTVGVNSGRRKVEAVNKEKARACKPKPTLPSQKFKSVRETILVGGVARSLTSFVALLGLIARSVSSLTDYFYLGDLPDEDKAQAERQVC